MVERRWSGASRVPRALPSPRGSTGQPGKKRDRADPPPPRSPAGHQAAGWSSPSGASPALAVRSARYGTGGVEGGHHHPLLCRGPAAPWARAARWGRGCRRPPRLTLCPFPPCSSLLGCAGSCWCRLGGAGSRRRVSAAPRAGSAGPGPPGRTPGTWLGECEGRTQPGQGPPRLVAARRPAVRGGACPSCPPGRLFMLVPRPQLGSSRAMKGNRWRQQTPAFCILCPNKAGSRAPAGPDPPPGPHSLAQLGPSTLQVLPAALRGRCPAGGQLETIPQLPRGASLQGEVPVLPPRNAGGWWWGGGAVGPWQDKSPGGLLVGSGGLWCGTAPGQRESCRTQPPSSRFRAQSWVPGEGLTSCLGIGDAGRRPERCPLQLGLSPQAPSLSSPEGTLGWPRCAGAGVTLTRTPGAIPSPSGVQVSPALPGPPVRRGLALWSRAGWGGAGQPQVSALCSGECGVTGQGIPGCCARGVWGWHQHPVPCSASAPLVLFLTDLPRPFPSGSAHPGGSRDPGSPQHSPVGASALLPTPGWPSR